MAPFFSNIAGGATRGFSFGGFVQKFDQRVQFDYSAETYQTFNVPSRSKFVRVKMWGAGGGGAGGPQSAGASGLVDTWIPAPLGGTLRVYVARGGRNNGNQEGDGGPTRYLGGAGGWGYHSGGAGGSAGTRRNYGYGGGGGGGATGVSTPDTSTVVVRSGGGGGEGGFGYPGPPYPRKQAGAAPGPAAAGAGRGGGSTGGNGGGGYGGGGGGGGADNRRRTGPGNGGNGGAFNPWPQIAGLPAPATSGGSGATTGGSSDPDWSPGIGSGSTNQSGGRGGPGRVVIYYD